MLKLLKTLCLTMILMASSTSFSADQNLYNSGIYGGACIGFGHLSGRFSNRYHVGNALPERTNVTQTGRAGNSSLIGSLIFGTRHFFNDKFFIGLEIDGTVMNQKTDKNIIVPINAVGRILPVPYNIALEKKFSAISSLVFGATLSPRWHAFLKLGLSVTNAELSLFNPNDNLKVSKKLYAVGFAPGFGIEYAYNKRISYVAFVNYEYYPDISHKFGQEINPLTFVHTPFITSDHLKFNLNSFSAKIGIIFKV